MDIKVFLSVGPMRKSERIIPEWKNKIVNAAIDYPLLHASGVRNFDVLLNDEPSDIYATIQDGDLIELVPTGG